MSVFQIDGITYTVEEVRSWIVRASDASLSGNSGPALVAGMIDIFRCQGSWFHALRLAFLLQVDHGSSARLEYSIPDARVFRTLAKAVEVIFDECLAAKTANLLPVQTPFAETHKVVQQESDIGNIPACSMSEISSDKVSLDAASQVETSVLTEKIAGSSQNSECAIQNTTVKSNAGADSSEHDGTSSEGKESSSPLPEKHLAPKQHPQVPKSKESTTRANKSKHINPQKTAFRAQLARGIASEPSLRKTLTEWAKKNAKRGRTPALNTGASDVDRCFGFCQFAVKSFFENDLLHAIRFFMRHALGSFSLTASSSLDIHRQVCCCLAFV